MSYEAEFISITDYFNTQWASATPIAWPNVRFDPDEHVEFVRVTILNGDAFQASMGNDVNDYRHLGIVVVQIFVEPNSGAKRARSLVDSVCSIFRSKYIDDLRFRTPDVNTIGIREGRYQVNVNCPFYRDEIF